MKAKIFYLLLALCMLGVTTSCSTSELEESIIPTYSTGDEADDPALPTEDD